MQIDLIFYNGTVILPDLLLDDGVVLCTEGKISNIGRYDDITLPEFGYFPFELLFFYFVPEQCLFTLKLPPLFF